LGEHRQRIQPRQGRQIFRRASVDPRSQLVRRNRQNSAIIDPPFCQYLASTSGDRAMAHSFHQNFAHLVFSTKERRPIITAEIQSRLHAYLGGIVRELDGSPLKINGMPDHVHILAKTPRTIADMDFMRTLKTNSSKWVHETFPSLSHFAWQVGYGWFSVSKSVTTDVEGYIERQQEHHRRMSFQEEFLAILKKHEIEYDERFLWD
jgi:REP element-mobilizing transposase RayT